MEDGNRQIHVSRASFESINTGVGEMMERIQQVTASMSDILVNADKVNHSVNEIATVSEEAAAGIEQSSATAEQQSSDFIMIKFIYECVFCPNFYAPLVIIVT